MLYIIFRYNIISSIQVIIIYHFVNKIRASLSTLVLE